MVEKSSGPSSQDENKQRGSKPALRDVLRGIFHRLRKTPFHPQWLVARGAEKHLQAVAGLLHGKILDVGSGDRPLENYLKPQVRYIGIDYPPSGQRYRKIPHVWGDAIHLPFRSGTMDSLVLLEVLEHLPYPGLALNEAACVLKDGGIAVVSVPFLYPIHDAPFDFGRITQYQIERLAADTGFEVLRLTERGKALETAAMLVCLALAQAAIEALQKRSPVALILVPTLLMVPILNISGYVLSQLFPVRHFMPSGYLAVFKKTTDRYRPRPT
jgi:SAM-dependent methyltransferase